MPVRIQNDLPARKILEEENIFVMDDHRAEAQDIRALKILILNLMPLKEVTETQILRCLSNTPLQFDVTFMTTHTYQSKNTSRNHLMKFYSVFDEIKDMKFDGFIVTGAPVEHLDFEEVDYWEELKQILDWSKSNVTSTLHICWGAQAALYHHYGVDKCSLNEKMFGVFSHQVINRTTQITRGFDDVFYAPHSRHTGNRTEDILKVPELTVLSESSMAGVYLIEAAEGKQIYVTGHPEYDALTLDTEYRRDRDKGLPIQIPFNYYPDDNTEQEPVVKWRSHAHNLYTNWLNYYVYQRTPFDLK